MLESLWRDIVYAWRGLRRSPTFTIVVVLTIAIGIGANATVLSIIDIAFLRTVPVANPDRIVRVQCADTSALRRGSGLSRCSFPDWRELSQRVRGLDGLAGYAMTYVRFGGDLAGQQPYGAFVTGNYFSVAGVRPQRGRFIAEDEAVLDDVRPVVVISDVLWRTAFGADDAIVGRRIRIGSGEFTIVGVAPAGFSGLHPEGRTDFWLPWTTQALAVGRDDFRHMDARVMWTPMFGRLKAGATLAEVQGSLDNARRQLATTHAAALKATGYRAELRSKLVYGPAAMNALSTFIVAWIVVALVHVIACANVAGLVVARLAARRRELGIRLCLGASRERVLAQGLAEPALLAVLGAAGGLILARWFSGLITGMWFMSALDRGLDARVTAIVTIVAAASALLFGLAPVLAATRRDPMEVLRSASPSRAADIGRGPSETILVLQSALSLVLLTQALLLVGKFRRENAAELGFADAQLVTAQMRLASGSQAPGGWQSMYETAIERAAAVPGVRAVAAVGNPPLSFGGWFERVTIPGRDERPDDPTTTWLNGIGPGYFATLGARLVSGREFEATDRRLPGEKGFGKFDVAVVNERFAKLYWPGEDPIGKTVTFRNAPARVVGVVRDLRDGVLSGVQPRVYFPMLEFSHPQFFLVARVDGDVDASAARLRSALVGIANAEAPVVRTMNAARADQLTTSRVLSLALTACAGIALLLSAIGLYGAVSMWAAGRRAEIGIRLALGARAAHVHRLLVFSAGRFTGIGLIAGVLLSAALVQIERSRYGPSLVLEPASVSFALLVFVGATVLAAVIPAIRASKVPPAEVLWAS